MSERVVYVLMKSGGQVHGVTDSNAAAQAWAAAGGLQVVVTLNEILPTPYSREFWGEDGEWVS